MTAYRPFHWLKLPALALLWAAVPSTAAMAKEATAAPAANPLDQRTQELVGVLKGGTNLDSYFAPSFLEAVPADKFTELAKSLITNFGQPVRVTEVHKTGPNSAKLQIAYEKAVGSFDIYIDPAKPHKVTGLLATGFAVTGDSVEKIDADFSALAGVSGYGVYELGANGGVKRLAGRNADKQFAIGSTFKLYILAELAGEIVSEQRKWSDVAPLSHHSFSSQATNRWPPNSPATLHSLATWMISVSDNSATDTLLFLLGREAVEAKLAMIGHGDPDKTLPFLSTVEAFTLKSAANAELRDRFLKASEARQRDLLTSEAAKLAYDKIDASTFSAGPSHIDTIEWFASTGDIALVLDNIRRTGSKDALEIMAVNPGLPHASATKWKYVGYKGGSEPGVMSMSYLLQAPSGKWLVIAGSWNNPKNAVSEASFASLMGRLVDSFAE